MTLINNSPAWYSATLKSFLSGPSLWLILSYCLGNLAWAQSVSTTLDRDSIFVGETVLLQIEANAQINGESPDIGLLTASFDILNSNSRTLIQSVNNQQTVLQRWTFELEPKSAGVIEIPALKIGPNLSTEPLQLNVLPAPQQADLTQDIFIELTAEPRNPYVQEQVRYSERIFLAIPLTDDQLRRDGAVQNALLQPLGEMKRYVAQRNGQNYQVFERNYALIPEQSGELNLPQLTLRGRIGNRQPGQQTLTRGRRITVHSEPLSLQVRPRPENYTATVWLPSWQLSLSEQWSPEPPVFRVGEPITRTLSIEAVGLDAGQLPELSMVLPEGLNLYPDQPQSTTRVENGWLIGQQEQKIALVPTQAGELNLPEISLIWWDTQTDQQRTVVLPAQTVSVLPAATTTAITAATSEPLTTATTIEQPLTGQESTHLPTGSNLNHWLSDSRLWRWLSLVLLLLWGLTLFAWRRDRQRSPAPTSPSDAPTPTPLKQLKQAALQACRTQDAPAAAQALLHWAGAIWPQYPPTNLGALALRCPHAAAAIRELDRAIYDANAMTPWRGDALATVLQAGLPLDSSSARTQQLPDDGLVPLYPQHP